jgi:hypothetical protein
MPANTKHNVEQTFMSVLVLLAVLTTDDSEEDKSSGGKLNLIGNVELTDFLRSDTVIGTDCVGIDSTVGLQIAILLLIVVDSSIEESLDSDDVQGNGRKKLTLGISDDTPRSGV